MEKQVYAKVHKVDDDLGLVFGWAIVCKQNGELFIDSQNDHIPEDSMLKAAADFMKNSRAAVDMHDPANATLDGSILFAFPLTAEIAKSFGIVCGTSGLMIAMQPENDEVLTKFKTGEYTGFSIGGKYVENVEGEI
jgi:hypothetical protein